VACGFELLRDTVDSTNLQTHRRTTDGFYAEISPHLMDGLYLNIGMREDLFSDFGWEYAPSVSVSYLPTKWLAVRSSAGRAYRIPTFTDLYYKDSANVGDSNLRPESSWSYEIGADLKGETMEFGVTYFRRDSDDTIDWTRSTSKETWRARNIGSVETNGLELKAEFSPKKTNKLVGVERIFMSYTALDQYNKHDYLSKYALDYLKHHISSGLEYCIFGIKNNWVLNYKKRVGDSGYLVVDTNIFKDIIRKDNLVLEAFLSISNLFDAAYSEQSDILMPGRWIKSGARVRF
jgi:iron complex outermembrane receptor protein